MLLLGIIVNFSDLTLHPKMKNRSTAIIFVTILFPRAWINLFLPVSLHHPSRRLFFCPEQAKGLEVICRGRYTMTICPYVTLPETMSYSGEDIPKYSYEILQSLCHPPLHTK